MNEKSTCASDLDHRETARFVVDLFHRIMIHHALWFTEVRHQMGMEKALEYLHEASRKSYEIQMKHLSDALGFDMVDGIPAPLLEMDDASLRKLKERVAKNWLANDGVWFQTIEFSAGLNEAKRCNDSCWAHFSPFEAATIKRLLGLPEFAGLDGLKRALGFRVYESINRQSITDESDRSFIFRMDECRVQQARQRKGLADYPCKSAGLVEYAYFARAIDKRIVTECIGCPPDEHPAEWFCAWKFTITD